jgi:hypothetical protein
VDVLDETVAPRLLPIYLFIRFIYLLIVNRTVDNRDLKKRGGKKNISFIKALLQLHRSFWLLGFAPSPFPRYNSFARNAASQPKNRVPMHACARDARTDGSENHNSFCCCCKLQ